MTLAIPAALLLLLCAVPIVVAFLRRPAPRAMMVSSLLLMEALSAAVHHRRLPPPRELLAMAMVLLALIGLVAALALRPPPQPDRLVLLDTSASMATAINGETRYEAALDALSEALRRTGSGNVTLITTAPPRIQVRSARRSEPILARAGAIPPSGEDGDVSALLAALCTDDAPLLIVLAEDRPLPATDCSIYRPALPDAPGNRGITGFTLREAGAVSLLAAHLEVAAEEPVEVTITADGLEPATLRLTPTDGTAQRILRLSLPAGGAVSAALVGDDAFPDDDTASVVVPPPVVVQTRLVTEHPEGFLAQALRAHPGVSLETVGPSAPATPVDLLVLEAPAAIDGARRVVALQGGLRSIPVEVLDTLTKPTLLPTDPAAPLVQYMDPTGLQVQSASALGLAEGATSLLTTDAGPVGVLLAGGEVVALGLSLSESDLALRLDFAHLIANVVEWSRPASEAIPTPEGVLSRLESTARAAAAVSLPKDAPRTIDHRLAVVLAGMLLVAEWGLQAWEAR